MVSLSLQSLYILILLCSVAQSDSTPLMRRAPASQSLNLTTIAVNHHKQSVIECWSVSELQTATTPGVRGALLGNLGDPNSLSFFDIPPGLNGGLHTAPVVQ